MAATTVRLCECGCGRRTNIAPQTNRAQGHVKGQPYRFRRGHGGRATRNFLDGRAVAYFTGCADARHGRPRRNYSGQFADAYHRGYDDPEAWSRER